MSWAQRAFGIKLWTTLDCSFDTHTPTVPVLHHWQGDPAASRAWVHDDWVVPPWSKHSIVVGLIAISVGTSEAPALAPNRTTTTTTRIVMCIMVDSFIAVDNGGRRQSFRGETREEVLVLTLITQGDLLLRRKNRERWMFWCLMILLASYLSWIFVVC